MSRTSKFTLLGLALVVLVVAAVVLRPGKDSPKSASSIAVTVKALKPVGGVQALKVKKGQRVRFSVSSDRSEEVHAHGYDIAKDVAPGKPARFDFPASIEGIFEVELEHASVPILKLTVNP
jgi:hypothetical protein